MSRRTAAIGRALLLGMAGPALFLEWATRPAPPEAEAADELPWPYCYPDALGPTFAPLPERPRELLLRKYGIVIDSREGAIWEPVTEGALVPVTDLRITGRVGRLAEARAAGDPLVDLYPPEVLRAIFAVTGTGEATVGPALSESRWIEKEFGSLAGTWPIEGEVGLLRTVAERLGAGHRVALAVSVWPDVPRLGGADLLHTDLFGLDLTTGEALWGEGFIE